MFDVPMSTILEKFEILDFNTDYDDYYGWEDFLLVSRKEKLQYLVSMLYRNITNYITIGGCVEFKLMTENFELFRKRWVIKLFNEYLYEDVSEIEIKGIDHQSHIDLPINIKTGKHSFEFFFDMCKAVLRSGVIHGGNDNSDGSRYGFLGELDEAKVLGNYYETFIAKDGDWYTIFHSGDKIRISFEENPKPFTGANSPELLDVKITNYCEHNCAYCYQGATSEYIKPAVSEYTLKSLINRLAPFEVVLGGGEILQHEEDVKYFTNLVSQINKNISVAVTVRDPSVLSKLDTKMLHRISAIGISINTVEDAEIKYTYIRENLPDLHYDTSIIFHITMGTISEKEFYKIMEHLSKQGYSRVLLLGFKETGRGGNYKKLSYNWLPTAIKKFYAELTSIGVDTKLAQEFQSAFEKMGIVKESYFTKEGYVSAYVDAVKSAVGISSYGETYPIESYEYSVPQKFENKILELMAKVQQGE